MIFFLLALAGLSLLFDVHSSPGGTQRHALVKRHPLAPPNMKTRQSGVSRRAAGSTALRDWPDRWSDLFAESVDIHFIQPLELTLVYQEPEVSDELVAIEVVAVEQIDGRIELVGTDKYGGRRLRLDRVFGVVDSAFQVERKNPRGFLSCMLEKAERVAVVKPAIVEKSVGLHEGPVEWVRQQPNGVPHFPPQDAEHHRKTETISEILRDIFETQEYKPRIIQTLDSKHLHFIEILTMTGVCSWAKLDEIARELGLMSEGAVATINEWAHEQFDAVLIDDSDPQHITCAGIRDN